MVGDFSGGYSQTDCIFNFNINVNVTVDSYMSSFNFSFSHQLKNLLASRILQLGSTSKIMAQFQIITQHLFFFSLFFYVYLRNKCEIRLTYFLIAFVSLYSLPGLPSPGCKFIKLKACNQIQFLTLDIIYICDKLVSFHSSKLDETILQLEIQISNYELLRCDRNRNGGGVSCCIRSDIGFVQKRFSPRKIKNIFVEILLTKTKPLIVGIIYRPPNQSNFLEIINANFDKLKSHISMVILI